MISVLGTQPHAASVPQYIQKVPEDSGLIMFLSTHV